MWLKGCWGGMSVLVEHLEVHSLELEPNVPKITLGQSLTSRSYIGLLADAHVRLWDCRPGTTEMESFCGPWGAGDWHQYKDVGDDVAVRQIEVGFTRFPPTPHAGQTSDTYGQTTPRL